MISIERYCLGTNKQRVYCIKGFYTHSEAASSVVLKNKCVFWKSGKYQMLIELHIPYLPLVVTLMPIYLTIIFKSFTVCNELHFPARTFCIIRTDCVYKNKDLDDYSSVQQVIKKICHNEWLNRNVIQIASVGLLYSESGVYTSIFCSHWAVSQNIRLYPDLVNAPHTSVLEF